MICESLWVLQISQGTVRHKAFGGLCEPLAGEREWLRFQNVGKSTQKLHSSFCFSCAILDFGWVFFGWWVVKPQHLWAPAALVCPGQPRQTIPSQSLAGALMPSWACIGLCAIPGVAWHADPWDRAREIHDGVFACWLSCRRVLL